MAKRKHTKTRKILKLEFCEVLMKKRIKNLWTARISFSVYITALLFLIQPVTPVHAPIISIPVAYADQSDYKVFAQILARNEYGWGQKEFECIDNVYTKESHWNPKADNPKSTAYGIAQLLGEDSKDWTIQIANGFKYIEHRYGTPCEAWKFWQKEKWY